MTNPTLRSILRLPFGYSVATFGVCVILGTEPCWSAATITQELQPAAVHLGDTAKLNIAVTDGGWTKLLRLPQVDGLTVIRLGPEDIERTQDHLVVISRFSIVPTRTGDFVIPAFDLKTQTSEILHIHPITLHVVDAGENIPPQLLKPSTEPVMNSPAGETAVAIYPQVATPIPNIDSAPPASIPSPVLMTTPTTSPATTSSTDNAEAASYRIRATAGDAEAALKLGLLYCKGTGVPQNLTEGIKWIEKAADQGNASAENDVAIAYFKGQGVTQDYPEAVIWFIRAANQGNVNAQRTLGAIYSVGQGVPEDDAQAFEWFKKAAEQGDVYSEHHVGEMYEIGRGVSPDDSEAARWLRKAADQGDAESKSELALIAGNQTSERNVTTNPSPTAPNAKIYSGKFKIFQIISTGIALANQVLGGEIMHQTYLLAGVPADSAEGDLWQGNIYRGNNFTYKTVDGIQSTIRTYIVTDAKTADGSFPPELNTIPVAFPTGDQIRQVIWADNGHGRSDEYTIPNSLAKPFMSLTGLTGPITVDMINRLRQGDTSGVDSISKGLSHQDREILLKALRAATNP